MEKTPHFWLIVSIVSLFFVLCSLGLIFAGGDTRILLLSVVALGFILIAFVVEIWADRELILYSRKLHDATPEELKDMAIKSTKRYDAVAFGVGFGIIILLGGLGSNPISIFWIAIGVLTIIGGLANLVLHKRQMRHLQKKEFTKIDLRLTKIFLFSFFIIMAVAYSWDYMRNSIPGRNSSNYEPSATVQPSSPQSASGQSQIVEDLSSEYKCPTSSEAYILQDPTSDWPISSNPQLRELVYCRNGRAQVVVPDITKLSNFPFVVKDKETSTRLDVSKFSIGKQIIKFSFRYYEGCWSGESVVLLDLNNLKRGFFKADTGGYFYPSSCDELLRENKNLIILCKNDDRCSQTIYAIDLNKDLTPRQFITAPTGYSIKTVPSGMGDSLWFDISILPDGTPSTTLIKATN